MNEYFRFVTDSDGSLRRYLFESNVRDYMGTNYVNSSIESTLARGRSAADEDFWWLNNGVTVIASQATVVGKELHLENVQGFDGFDGSRCAKQRAYGISGASVPTRKGFGNA